MTKNLIQAILITLTLMLCFSCTKVEEEDLPTTYTFTYIANDIAGLTVDITLFEYNTIGEKIGVNTLSNCKGGTMRTFTASKIAEKVKIFYILSSATAPSSAKWVQQVFYLNKSDNTPIEMSATTIVGPNEP